MSYSIVPAPGTITVAHNSTNVVGVGTMFTTFSKGALLIVPGVGLAQVADDPADDTHCTLVADWGFADVAAEAYLVVALSDPAVFTGRVRQLFELLSSGNLGALDALVLSANKLLATDGSSDLTQLDLDTDDSLAADSDTRVATQKAVKGYADTKIATSALDTDDTLTANSDAKVASQKATRGFVEAAVATGGTDNALLRADGAGGHTSQPSVAVLDDAGNLTGLASANAKLNSAATTSPQLTAEQAGAGDALAQWLLTGGQAWVAGIDNSDGDAWKLANANNGFTAANVAVRVDAISLAVALTALLDLSGAGAGQIKFPAAQNPSANANTLDDYEEGTFTPTIIGTGTAGAGTYSVQAGHYIKIGGRVFFDIELVWSAHTGTTGMKVSGLPFANGARKSPVALSWSNLTFAAALHGYVEASASTIALMTAATGGAEAALAIDAAATLRVSGSYSVV